MADITVRELAEALEGFRLGIHSDAGGGDGYGNLLVTRGTIADPAEVATVLHATLSRTVAEREPAGTDPVTGWPRRSCCNSWPHPEHRTDCEARHAAAPARTGPACYNGAGGMQPFDVIDAFGLDFYEGSALKYLIRWRRKDRIRDLEKCAHYIDILIRRERAKDLSGMQDPEGSP